MSQEEWLEALKLSEVVSAYGVDFLPRHLEVVELRGQTLYLEIQEAVVLLPLPFLVACNFLDGMHFIFKALALCDV